MLKTGPKRKFFYSAAKYVYVVCCGMCSFVVWAMELDKHEPWLAKRTLVWGMLEKFQAYAIYILALLVVLIGICFLVRRMADPWVVEKLQFILDRYQEKVFKNANAAYDHNRVTLFKYNEGLWFKRHWQDRPQRWWRPFKTRRLYGNYLVPFMRSGHMALKTKTVFYIDCENSSRTEGIAGEAWAKKGVVIRPDLPEITADSGKKIKESYAKVTNSNVRFLEKYIVDGRLPPRSIVAMPVECKGRLWGVIVLDSLDPLGVTKDSVDHYTLTVALIGELLERA